MKDQELTKIWKENLNDEQFKKIASELEAIKELRTAREFSYRQNRSVFIPALVTCSVILFILFIQSRTSSYDYVKEVAVIELASVPDYLEIYDYYLMEETL